ncbi:DUF6160 family protein [Thalassolituus sp. UBA2009]|jgi:hypothetical protein|uniref:DUF6160 family protein n=1 Tax=Thalassolituus sp. UBA2009 TaxID=1947658 RepID=UPI00257A51A7|nr:DUF6160 family protein [Thalassolituus sp. UBA2009]
MRYIFPLCFLSPCLAFAALDPVSDTQLADISGQDGITIVTSARLTVGQIEYRDEGRLQINQVALGGANRSSYFGKDWGYSSRSGDRLDGTMMTVDVLPDGDIVLSAFVDPGLGGGVIDFGLSTGQIALSSADNAHSAALINSVSVAGLATQYRMKVDAQTTDIQIQMAMGIADLDVDATPLGINVRNMVLANHTYFESLEDWGSSALSLSDVQLPVGINIHASDLGLDIRLVNFFADMNVEAIELAQESIGRVAVDDLNLGGLNMRISGHL